MEIPAGRFLMGTRQEDIPDLVKRFKGERAYYEDETPRHPVDLPAYYIARYPVTAGQFQIFVQAGGYRAPGYWPEAQAAGVWRDGRVKDWLGDELRDAPYDFGGRFSVPNHLVVGVTWYEALAYSRWLTERLQAWENMPEPLASLLRETGWQVRLPTEAEWEKAARGTDGQNLPWGDEPDPNRANYRDTEINSSSPIGCFPGGASPYGVQDLSGNVWEWCYSLYKPYPYKPSDGREDTAAEGNRVLRGGAFYADLRSVRCACRYRNLPNFGYDYRGFRVVVAPGFL